MTGLIVLGAIAVTGYLLVVRVSPVHRCPACKGRKAVAAGRGMKPCRRCKGTGKAARRGARIVHRAARGRRDGTR